MSTREAILEAADRLFGEVGFEGASTRRIGELSGVNKALIHYHFKDKGAVWDSVLERYYDRLGATLGPVLGRSGSPRQMLVALTATYLDFLGENRTFARMVQREVAGGRHVERITLRMLPLFGAGASMLEQTFPATREGPLSAAQLLVSFYGMAVTWVTYAPVVEGLAGIDPLGAEGLALRKAHLAKMVELVIAGLEQAAAAPPAGASAAPAARTTSIERGSRGKAAPARPTRPAGRTNRRRQ